MKRDAEVEGWWRQTIPSTSSSRQVFGPVGSPTGPLEKPDDGKFEEQRENSCRSKPLRTGRPTVRGSRLPDSQTTFRRFGNRAVVQTGLQKTGEVKDRTTLLLSRPIGPYQASPNLGIDCKQFGILPSPKECGHRTNKGSCRMTIRFRFRF